ncbi:MAG: hypothetical protein U0235_21030 [Polyangiaceae bacterium]
MNGARTKAVSITTASSRTSTRTTARSTGVLYYLAYEYEQSNWDNANARKVYLELHQQAPGLEVHPERVPRVRRALLQRSAGRSLQVELAQQAYTEVIKFPPEKNKVYGYAWYKIGYVF